MLNDTETPYYVIINTETGQFWNALAEAWGPEKDATAYPGDAVESHWDRCDAAGVPSCPLPGEWVSV